MNTLRQHLSSFLPLKLERKYHVASCLPTTYALALDTECDLLCHLNSHKICGWYYYIHFMSRETESQRHFKNCPKLLI